MSEPRLILGDCIERMAELAEASIDAVVCDPPYELNFMGRDWDRSGVAFQKSTWGEAYRVLKPGGHLLAFGGTRTVHRIAVAIEGMEFVGIERDPDYMEIARARIAFWAEHGEEALRIVSDREQGERRRAEVADAGQLDLFASA